MKCRIEQKLLTGKREFVLDTDLNQNRAEPSAETSCRLIFLPMGGAVEPFTEPATKDARTREVAHYWPELLFSSFLLAGGVAPPLERRNSAIIDPCLGSVIFLTVQERTKRTI